MKDHASAIIELFNPSDCLLGAEVGVWCGDNSRHLMVGLPKLRLFMVDTWMPPKPDSRYHQSGDSKAVASHDGHRKAFRSASSIATRFMGQGIIIRASSLEAASWLSDGILDFVFIDADHSYGGVCEDIGAWMPKVKPGGVLSGHDYTKYGVADAVRDTLGDCNLSHGDTWWIRR